MRRALAATVALAAVLTACQLILGIEREPGALVGEGGTPPVVPGPDATPQCVFARPPPRPAEQDGATLLEMFFAVREFRFARGATLRGYDLDGYCTGEATSPNRSPCKRGKTQIADQDGGVDNASASVQLFATPAPAMNLNSQIAKGAFTVLLQLTEYNGLPDDDYVQLAFISGTGRTAGADCTEEPLTDATTGECPAKWDFPANEDPILPRPFLRGWVRDSLLVVQSTEQLRFGFGQATLGLGTPIVTAQLVARDGTWTLVDGIVTGRVPVSNLLGVIGAFDIEGLGGQVCGPDSGVGALAKQGICDARDLMASPDAEPTEDSCDGLSFVMGFDAVRARTGGTKEIKDASPCPDEYLRCPD